ncbi:MAG TPA: FGGY family carbohydrate kinase, partial [Chitinophagaceae bacterium]|nr:FGGY family carbohydrate kinase [Chitinophagaceae bacterium]
MHSVIAIFDLGRTNKKFILFDRDYHIVEEIATNIPDIKDEDGDDCEDLAAIFSWMKQQLQAALDDEKYNIKAINFSSHGASFVHLDQQGNPVTPLYDYMKPLKQEFLNDFYGLFGGKENFP